MQQSIQKKAFISVKHKDTEIEIKTDTAFESLMLFITIMGIAVFAIWMKWGRNKDRYHPKHTNKDNQ